jgi:hypothetical protein
MDDDPVDKNTWTVNDANDATSSTSPADIDIEINSPLLLLF